MNNGKICVSVCAETAKEFIENIRRAEEFADVIELRFDCLEKREYETHLSEIFHQNSQKKFLATFRPQEQGGKRHLTKNERDFFWTAGYDHCWADLEEDVVENSFNWLFDKRICSYHDFKESPSNLNDIYERLKATNANIIKIAVRADDAIYSIPIWKLLAKAKAEGKQIIPIAMGEAGKWTRILGLAHGAFMTYAALGAGNETAPGQISARDLAEVYRVKELNEKTEVFGILGENTSYSMSPFIHNAAFKFHHLNSVFVPFQVKNLDEFVRRMVKPETREIDLNFRGFAVTIPHKIEIIKHLARLDESAAEIGAVNTISIIENELRGFNTDAEGFIQPLRKVYGDLTDARTAVIGSGGAARAVCYALKKAGAKTTVFARNLRKAENLKTDFRVRTEEFSPTKKYDDFDILVNTTPLGTKGSFEDQTVADAEQLAGLRLVYDLVYNPLETKLMREAEKVRVAKIGGLEMLIAQAAAQQKIWTRLDAPLKEMKMIAIDKLKSQP